MGKGANLFENGYVHSGSSVVITRYLRTAWLWEKVRVQGGAYGGFCSLNQYSGMFNYLSYRDPNLQKTLDAYDGTPGFLRNLSLDKDEQTRSIIGAIGDMDGYQLPDAKGYTALVRKLTGITDEYRQQLRDQILGTTLKDFHQFADVLDYVTGNGQIIVLGSESRISSFAKESGLNMPITRVL